jgi:DNA polymerase III epsilon subunit-like protein
VKISEATFCIFDVESTGLDPAKDKVVEVAVVAMSLSNPLLGMWASLVNPMMPIPPEVSAVHGLTDRDLAFAPPWETVLPQLHAFLAPMTPIVKASHNFQFDRKFLKTKHGVCTERLARHLWLDRAPNFKNNTLRYWRELRPEIFGIASHRALGDALVTADLLRNELSSPEFLSLEIDDTEALIEYCESPIIHTKWPFGKYGPKHPDGAQPIDASDLGYITWCLTKMEDLSPDMRATLERVIAQPLASQRGAA